MKKRLKKHIQAKDFVKIYLADQDGFELYRFDGIVRDQNDDYILMVDFTDLTYDGVVVFRKADVSEIKHSKNEIFFNTVLAQEGFKDKALKKANKLGLHLNDFKGMIEQVKTQKLPLILERLYEKETKFQIGSVKKTGKKKAHINYFNAHGEFDFKPVSSKYVDITFVRIGDPYSTNMFKHAKKIN